MVAMKINVCKKDPISVLCKVESIKSSSFFVEKFVGRWWVKCQNVTDVWSVEAS